MFAFVGSFSKPELGSVFNGSSDGVCSLKVDPVDGSMEQVDVAPLPDPSFVAVLPSRRVLYAASHSVRFEGETGAGVTAFSISPDGKLSRLNSRRIPHPHVTMIAPDILERFLFVTSSLGGAISALPIEPDGRLGPISDVTRFEGKTMIAIGEAPAPTPIPGSWMAITRMPEFGATNVPHCVASGAAGGWLLVADYGASAISVLGFDASKGVFTQNKRFSLGRERAAPRFLALHPNKHTFYSVNELESKVSVYELDAATGAVQEVQTLSALPAGAQVNNTGSGIAIHPTGRFLWTSNRGHNSITTFTIDGKGRLELTSNVPSGGAAPWNLGLTPDARLLYASNTIGGTLAAFAVDDDTGVLSPRAVTKLPAPTSAIFLS